MFETGYYVRDAEEMEVFGLVEASHEVLRESVYGHMDLNKEKTANFLMDGILKRPNTFFRCISDKNGELVGGMMCVCDTSLFGADKIAYDVTIMVKKEHRGKCLPQLIQIIREYKDWATAEGAKMIKIGVSSGINIDKASSFFERLGFDRVGSMHSARVGA